LEQRVADLATSEGLDYRTDRQVGSTLDAHRLLQFARERDLQARLLKELFDANFGRAESIFTVDALLKHAESVGLDAAQAHNILQDENRFLDAVQTDERDAARHGAGGSPSCCSTVSTD